MDNIKTIYIAGLHRSGSTILCFLLGAHPECIAVGEVEVVIRADQDRNWVESHYNRCTCGNCDFWPVVMDNIDKASTKDLKERYKIFLSTFKEFFPGKIPVDSSKFIVSLQAIRAVSHCVPIFIIRDVRGWCISQKEKITPRLMLRWYKNNLAYKRMANDALLLGYERLVFDIQNVLYSLCKHIGLDYDEKMLEIPSPTDHILVGNRMRTNKAIKIKYDGRWMQMNSIWPLLLFPVMNYNRKMVYTSTIGQAPPAK